MIRMDLCIKCYRLESMEPILSLCWKHGSWEHDWNWLCTNTQAATLLPKMMYMETTWNLNMIICKKIYSKSQSSASMWTNQCDVFSSKLHPILKHMISNSKTHVAGYVCWKSPDLCWNMLPKSITKGNMTNTCSAQTFHLLYMLIPLICLWWLGFFPPKGACVHGDLPWQNP